MQKTSLTVVLPMYNPEKGWAEIVKREWEWIKSTFVDFSIDLIIVNDGSTKNVDELKQLKNDSDIKIINRFNNFGKGYTLREGVKESNADYIIYTDIDFPYKRESFEKIIYALSCNPIVIGIRDNKYYLNMPKSRLLVSKILRFCIKLFLRIPTDDTQCGLKGFNKQSKEVFSKTTINRYLFDLEFIYIAARNNISIATENVVLRPDVKLSKMNIKVLINEVFNFVKVFFKNV